MVTFENDKCENESFILVSITRQHSK